MIPCASGWSSWECHTLFVEVWNRAAPLGEGAGCFLQSKTAHLPDSIPEYLLKRNGNICSPRDLYVNINSSFIHQRLKLGVTRVSSVSEWTDCGAVALWNITWKKTILPLPKNNRTKQNQPPHTPMVSIAPRVPPTAPDWKKSALPGLSRTDRTVV